MILSDDVDALVRQRRRALLLHHAGTDRIFTFIIYIIIQDIFSILYNKTAENDIRMCLDMRRANAAIIRERYPIPTVDELLQGMNGSVTFSKLDLKWGYHQLELTPKSRGIATFAVHTGSFRYKRLIFGVSSASEQYQHEIATALAGIEGVENISDDIIVHAPDQETHDERL